MKKFQIIAIIALILLIQTLNGQYFSSWEDSTVSRIGKRVNDDDEQLDFIDGPFGSDKYKNILLGSHRRHFKQPENNELAADDDIFNKRLSYIISGLSQLDKTKKVN